MPAGNCADNRHTRCLSKSDQLPDQPRPSQHQVHHPRLPCGGGDRNHGRSEPAHEPIAGATYGGERSAGDHLRLRVDHRVARGVHAARDGPAGAPEQEPSSLQLEQDVLADQEQRRGHRTELGANYIHTINILLT